MKWLILLIILIIFNGWIAINYWQDTQADVTNLTLLGVFIGIPLLQFSAFIFLIKIFNFLKDAFFQKSKDELQVNDANTTEIATVTTPPPSIPTLPTSSYNIYANVIVTPLGNNIEKCISILKNGYLAEPDPIFSNQKKSYFTKRVDLPPLTNKERKVAGLPLLRKPYAPYLKYTERTLRIKLILDQLVSQLDKKISRLSTGINASASWTSPQGSIYLHPTWNGLPDDISLPTQSEEIAPQWPEKLRIINVLPSHLPEDELFYLQNYLMVYFSNLKLEEEIVEWCFYSVSSSEDFMKILKEDKSFNTHSSEDKTIHLLISADSWIDEAFLTELHQKEKSNLIASEGGFAMLFANCQVKIPQLHEIAVIERPIFSTREESLAQNNDRIEANELKELLRAYQYHSLLQPQTHRQFNINKDIVAVDARPNQIKQMQELFLGIVALNDPNLLSTASLLEDTDSLSVGLGLSIAIASKDLISTKLFISNTAEFSRMLISVD